MFSRSPRRRTTRGSTDCSRSRRRWRTTRCWCGGSVVCGRSVRLLEVPAGLAGRCDGLVVDGEDGEVVHGDPVLAGGSPAVLDVGEPDPGLPDAVVLPAGVDEPGDGLALVGELRAGTPVT